MGSIVSCRNKPAQSATGEEPSEKSEESSIMSNKINGTFEVLVCNVDDIPDEGMKTFEVEGSKILLAKSNNEISAIGPKCSHYGLPLDKGAMCNGRVRCPFHGACFSLKTGDIEDFPGLDSIPTFQVNISEDGKVKVKGSRSELQSGKRVKLMSKRNFEDSRTFVVVGGGAAGSKCVETLRQEGFTGQIIFVMGENCLPYDRPKLSKMMHLTADAMALRTSSFYEEADIEIELGCSLVNLNSEFKTLTLTNGKELSYDKILIATGGKPRTLSIPGNDLDGVYVLRNPSDGNAIAQAAKGKHVIVIGTSFIGMEAAAYLSLEDRCSSVTVIGNSSVPFERSLGKIVGERIMKLFESKGVMFVNNASVSELQGVGSVEKVITNDGKELEAEVVIAGIGVVPSTSYLKNSGVHFDDNGYVPVNEEMQTNVKEVYCAGDIALFPLFMADDNKVSIGHWQIAHKHGHVAALNMLDKKTIIQTVPFFWTMFYGKSVRYAGYGSFDDVIIHGDIDDFTFIAYYCQLDRVVALASVGRDPAAAKYANYLFQGKFLTKDQVMEDGEIIMKLEC